MTQSTGVGLTAAQTAQIVGNLRWTIGRLFEITGQWAAHVDRPDAAVCLATTSRHLGWHVDDLAKISPDSVLLADLLVVGPHAPQLETALNGIEGAGLAGSTNGDATTTDARSLGCVAVAFRVLVPRAAAWCHTVAKATAPHCDAPLQRVLDALQADLRRDRDEGESVLTRALSSADLVEAVSRQVVVAELALVEAEGLFPNRMPEPDPAR